MEYEAQDSPDLRPQTDNRRQLATQLAQRRSNQNYATRQGNQFAQAPYFQAEGLDSTVQGGHSDDRTRWDENGTWVGNSPYTGGGEKTPPATGPVPQTTAGPVAQFPQQASPAPAPAPAPAATTSAPASSSPNSAESLAMQIVQQMYGLAKPDSQGSKEIAKEQLLAQQKQALEQIAQSAASRGLSGGWQAGTEAEILSQLGPNLTEAWRNIDLQDQNQYFANLLATLGGAQGLANLDLDQAALALQGELGRGQLDVARGGLGIQSEDLALRRAAAERDANNEFWRYIIPLLA